MINKFEQTINSSQEKAEENKGPFASGEVFDAQTELVELKKFHGQAGLEKLAEFKEKLRFQKLGLTKMEAAVLDYLDKNEQVKETEILDFLQADIEKYALSQTQIEALQASVKDLVRKNKNIRALVDTCRNQDGQVEPNLVYTKVFGEEPKGQVGLDVNSYSLYFRPSDNQDFCYVASGAYKRHRALKKKDLEYAQTSGGVKLDTYPSKKLNGLIAIQNAEFFDHPEVTKRVADHEKRHVINGIIAKYFTSADNEDVYRRYQSLTNQVGQEDNEVDQELVDKLGGNLDIEKRIKDEICAHFKDGHSSKRISKALLRDETIYDYGYDYNSSEDQEFDPEYLDLVEDGIVAFQELTKHGYDTNQAISLLLVEPLIKWPKIVSRIVDKKFDQQAWEGKKKMYISRLILKRDESLKESLDV